MTPPAAERRRVVVAGAGIGGLAAALACARAGHAVHVVEQWPQVSEVGAGIQLGPNAWRRLVDLGLEVPLREVVAYPAQLCVHDARTHRLLGRLRLGERAQARYGHPYGTVHRGDLQALLLRACQTHGVSLTLGQPALRCAQDDHVVCLEGDGFAVEGELLVAADGVWSRLRQQQLGDGPPRPSGHVAFRALVDGAALAGITAPHPDTVDPRQITVWLGPRMHAVGYPLRGGEVYNLVIIVQQGERFALAEDETRWNGTVDAARVLQAVADAHPALRGLVALAQGWRFWHLHARSPLRHPGEMAVDRVVLLGDAAHPMLPYLAQGAAMAIEDAAELAQALARHGSVTQAARNWAAVRQPRVARVQQRSVRNGHIFHATGAMRLGRDAAMALLGERLLDLPWLYSG